MHIFSKIEVPEDSRLFFCSDIHGELAFLLKSLDSLGFIKGKDVLIHAGDLIDRGSESFKTAKFFCNDESGSFFSVLGNHDMFAVHQDFDLWFFNGGKWILDDLPTQEDKLLFGKMIKELPLIIEVQHKNSLIGVTHACVPYEFEIWQDFVKYAVNNNNNGFVEEVLWQREFIEYKDSPFYKKSTVLGVDFTVHGHTVTKEPTFVANRLYIDTGLVYGKYLTVAELIDGKFIFHKFKGK